MSDSPEVHFVGRLGADPDLKFTQGGKAVVGFSFVVSKRWKDRNDEWQEKSSWLRVTAWDELAENTAASLKKGDLVMVHGTLETREYENREGETKLSVEIQAQHIGPSLKRAQAVVERIEREKTPAGRSKPKPEPEPDYGGYGDEEPF